MLWIQLTIDIKKNALLLGCAFTWHHCMRSNQTKFIDTINNFVFPDVVLVQRISTRACFHGGILFSIFISLLEHSRGILNKRALCADIELCCGVFNVYVKLKLMFDA